jgi:hypothetical protein
MRYKKLKVNSNSDSLGLSSSSSIPLGFFNQSIHGTATSTITSSATSQQAVKKL